MKVYYLSTCDTCKRIMKEVGIEDMELQDIKTNPISEDQYDELRKLVNSPKDLLNTRARKLRELNLTDEDYTDEKLKKLILEEYTFLKRPVFIEGDHLFIGNSKKTIEALKQFISEK